MKLFPVWLFFYLAFSLLRFTQNTAVSAEGYQPTVPSLVLVGSLIVAKAFLVMDVFKLMNRYDERPLVYSVLWKSGIYWVGSIIVFYIEQFVELLVKHHPFAQAQGELLARMDSARFGVIAIWLALLIFIFCGVREFTRTQGKSRMMQIWFGSDIKSGDDESHKVA